MLFVKKLGSRQVGHTVGIDGDDVVREAVGWDVIGLGCEDVAEVDIHVLAVLDANGHITGGVSASGPGACSLDQIFAMSRLNASMVKPAKNVAAKRPKMTRHSMSSHR